MAYIGQGIKQGTFKVLDTSGNTYNGSNTTFSLGTQVGSAAQLLVSHDGVIQLPGTDYTLASGGASITFSTAPASGASIFIVEISGAVGGTVTPSDTSVTADKLNSALLTGLTDIGAGIADADLFLIDDGGGGTLRKVAASRLSTYISPSSATDSFTITGSTPTLTIGDAGAEDTKIVFDGNAQDYYIALDDSADDLILGKGSTVGTTPIISMADDGDTKITSTSTATGDAALELHSTGNSNGNYTNLKFTSAGNTTGTFIKSNQAGSGNAGRMEFWTNNDGTSAQAVRMHYNRHTGISNNDNFAATYLFDIQGTGTLMRMNRADDGAMLLFQSAGSTEGNISISGSTCTYTTFTGAHWSQLSDNSKPTILKGTVMDSIDEMCDWYVVEFQDSEGKTVREQYILKDGESAGDTISHVYKGDSTGEKTVSAKIVKEENSHLPKVKVSDTSASTSVYGVFQTWDEDDDMNVVGLGTYVVRIHKDQTVAKGDLLESNGDGTAKKQSGTAMLSSTIAKVTANIKIETYSDGSYTVPCTLHCG